MSKRKPYKVKGKSILQLSRIKPQTIRNMSEKEIRAVVTRMKSAANKRLKRFEQAGISTPATRAYKPRSTKGMSEKQLRSEYKKLKIFLTAETGTRKGYRKFLKKVEEGLNKRIKKEKKKTGAGLAGSAAGAAGSAGAGAGLAGSAAGKAGGLSEREAYLDKLFKAYERIKAGNPAVADRILKYGVLGQIEDLMANDLDSIVNTINAQLAKEYEAEQENMVDTSDFFDIGENE